LASTSSRERFARGVLAAGIADHAGEIANQENHLVAEVLELAHLVEQHGVAEVQVRRGWIESRLHAQRSAKLEPRFQVFALDDFFGAAGDLLERCHRVVHVVPFRRRAHQKRYASLIIR